MAGRIKLEIQKDGWEVLVRGKLFLNQRQDREHLAIMWKIKVQTVIYDGKKAGETDGGRRWKKKGGIKGRCRAGGIVWRERIWWAGFHYPIQSYSPMACISFTSPYFYILWQHRGQTINA